MVTAFIYILDLIDAAARPTTYVGWTTDVERRLARHNAGTAARFTRGRRWRLLYSEELPDARAAMRREAELKKNRKLRAAIIAQARGGGV